MRIRIDKSDKLKRERPRGMKERTSRKRKIREKSEKTYE